MREDTSRWRHFFGFVLLELLDEGLGLVSLVDGLDGAAFLGGGGGVFAGADEEGALGVVGFILPRSEPIRPGFFAGAEVDGGGVRTVEPVR